MRALADWWDSVELWVTQLAFPFQVVLAIVVVLPVCWGLAGLVDRVVDRLVVVAASVAARRRGGPRHPDEG